MRSIDNKENTRGLVSKLQRYSIKDGPGIRTTVFCIGCNLRCRWCSNPEAMYPGKKVLYHVQKCQRCGTCAAASGGTISVDKDGCHIDRDLCKNLEEMVDICPYDAYETIGTELSAKELHALLMKDAVFYANSNGGVTFSGGECCMQLEFLLETIRLLKQDGIHVAIDTAGMWNFEDLKPLLTLADLILYDIKAIDHKLHKEWTGVDNTVILENARKLADMGKSMFIRLVMIPGVNDTPEELEARFSFVKSLAPAVERIDVLPYHNLGEGKYAAMQMEYPVKDIRSYEPGELEELVKPWSDDQIPVFVDP